MKLANFAMVILSILVFGCPQRREQTETVASETQTSTATTTAATTDTSVVTTAPPPVDTVIQIDRTRFLDQAGLGTAVGQDGMVQSQATTFRRGQPIYASIRAKEVPLGLAARAVWFDAKGKELSAESKPVPQNNRTVSFEARNAAKWRAGKYRVELWLGGDMVHKQEFTIQ